VFEKLKRCWWRIAINLGIFLGFSGAGRMILQEFI
jgi:hypothetical protein